MTISNLQVIISVPLATTAMTKSASGNPIADCIENSKPGGPVRNCVQFCPSFFFDNNDYIVFKFKLITSCSRCASTPTRRSGSHQGASSRTAGWLRHSFPSTDTEMLSSSLSLYQVAALTLMHPCWVVVRSCTNPYGQAMVASHWQGGNLLVQRKRSVLFQPA